MPEFKRSAQVNSIRCLSRRSFLGGLGASAAFLISSCAQPPATETPRPPAATPTPLLPPTSAATATAVIPATPKVATDASGKPTARELAIAARWFDDFFPLSAQSTPHFFSL